VNIDILYRMLEKQAPSLCVDRSDLEWIQPFGVAHDLVRVRSKNILLRIPLLSHSAILPNDNLKYQSAGFERCFPSGCVPRLLTVLAPTPDFEMGVLVVEEIVGRPPRLPSDLTEIGRSLASIHKLPRAESKYRAPIPTMRPVKDTVSLISARAGFLPLAKLDKEPTKIIEEEIAWAERFALESGDGEVCLCVVDCHPGNFVVDTSGKAWFVDLEKTAYSSPAGDLAHATLSTTIMLDPRCAATLTRAQIKQFYSEYRQNVGEECWHDSAQWFTPFRRLIWLRVLTWMAKWKAEEGEREAAGMDHYARNSKFAKYTADRIAYSLSLEGIELQREEWSQSGGLEFDN
jgi:thiamine kinase-like enzyme